MRNLMTRKTYDQLSEVLRQLREIELPAVSQEKQSCAEQGDLRENAGYEAARDKLELIQRRIYEYEMMLSGVEFIDDLFLDGSIVSVGTVVDIVYADTGKKETFTVLGPADSKPEHGIISFQSPLARGLIGKSAGSTVVLELPGGRQKVTIEAIRVYKPEA